MFGSDSLVPGTKHYSGSCTYTMRLQDHGTLKQELKALKSKKVEHTEFVDSVAHWKAKVRGAKQVKARGKAAAKSVARKYGSVPATWKTSTIDVSQQEAKRYLPPGASIWRANHHGSWQVHLKPHKRHSESWSLHDGNSQQAMLS